MPRQEAAGAAAVVHLCKLFVGGVPQAMGEGELEGIFAQHAQVQRVWLQRHRSEKQDKQHRGFGYVVYRDPGAVDRLLGDRPSRFLQPSSGVRLEVKRALSCREIQNGALRGPAAPPPPEACAAPSRPEPLFASWPPRQGGMGPRCFAPRGGWCPAGPVWPGAGAAPPEPEPLLGRWPPQQGGAGWGPAGPCQQHPAAARVVREMISEWARGSQMQASDDFVYVKESGRYCALQAGRANPKTWSLALECRNFQEGLSHEILYQERLFVMSRPRVFRKYHRILGLSGSMGTEAERRFLESTYRASFFEVPPFLKTCRGSPFHEATPVALGSGRRPVYVEPTPDAQLARLAEVAFEARESVPVLVIAKDRAQCDQLVERLRQAARSRGYGSAADDMVRSLSRTLCESDPEQWKENLNRSTLPLGDGRGASHGGSWRVTVTDPRGGRGTDYRVDDPGVDGRGGLLLIPTIVPTSQREWIQFLGRTARQDRRGQFCTVLCETDYRGLSARFGQTLPVGNGLEAVEAIISWGDREIAERIRGSAALYNCGVRVNELCEEVFGRRPELLQNAAARELLVDVCQRYRWMSVQEINEAFSRLGDPARVPSEARDMGRPSQPPSQMSLSDTSGRPRAGHAATPGSAGTLATPNPTIPKVVIFCLDWSLSMLSQDTGTHLSRFGTCVACVRRILHEQVRDKDLVGVVGFGNRVEIVVSPTPKQHGGARLDAQIAALQAQTLGGTCFFDAVAQCLQLLGQPGLAPANAQKWLVCLTDGDDLGSQRDNSNGELVTRMLDSEGIVDDLNMVMITVGKLKEKNLRVIDHWVERVGAGGGMARHLSEQNAGAISLAFNVVAEYLAAEVGGATEC